MDRDPPTGCVIDQMTMVHRHDERYLDPRPRSDMLGSLARSTAPVSLPSRAIWPSSTLWESYLDDECLAGQGSCSGSYAGLLSCYTHGTWFCQRYGHLWDGGTLPIATSGYERVIETARRSGEGFFAYNDSTNAAIDVISEDASQGANSLTSLCDVNNGQKTCDRLTNPPPQLYVAAARIRW